MPKKSFILVDDSTIGDRQPDNRSRQPQRQDERYDCPENDGLFSSHLHAGLAGRTRPCCCYTSWKPRNKG